MSFGRRERLFMDNKKNGGKGELIEFTRRDKDPLGSSQITNQKISAKSVECSTSPFSNEFMICSFLDDIGTKKDMPNIVFTNYDVSRPRITNYKQQETGEIVTKVDFSSPAICEILGHNNIGLTMNCRNKISKEREGANRSRGDEW